MQLKRLYIKKFRILENFEMNFNHYRENPITVLLGKNGAGKSTLLEAILFIFRNLHYSESLPIPFEYELEYSIHGFNIKIIASEHRKSKYEFEINGVKRTGKEVLDISKTWKYDKLPEKIEGILPENICVYYSGYAQRFEEYFEKTDEDYAKALRENKYFGFRPLFYYTPLHYRFILLGLFASPLDSTKKFILEKLGIEHLEYFDIILKRPTWNKRKDSDHKNLWNAEGRVRIFFDTLLMLTRGAMAISENEFVIRFDGSDLKRLLKSEIIPNEIELVKLLDAAYLGDYINTVNLLFKKKGVKHEIEYAALSEGEQQLIAIRGAIELLKARESLFLLDEPDTYLHPDWQRDLMKYLNEENNKDHYIMATHSPQTLSMVKRDNVCLLSNGEPFSLDSETFGRDSNSILEEVFGIDQRPSDIQSLIDTYFDLLSQNKFEDASGTRKKLEKLLDQNDPVFIKADAIIKRKNILGK